MIDREVIPGGGSGVLQGLILGPLLWNKLYEGTSFLFLTCSCVFIANSLLKQ